MPVIGEQSGFPCPGENCSGRMFPLDVEHEDEKGRIVRWRECKSCLGRQRTHETAFGAFRPATKRIDAANIHLDSENAGLCNRLFDPSDYR